MVDTKLLHTITSAYDLDQPTSIQAIHNGTNRVYKLEFPKGSLHQKLAVKVSTSSSERSINSKRDEKIILDLIRPRFPCVPELITPCIEPPQSKRHSWGLSFNEDKLISVYQWMPSRAYRGLEEQLTQVGKHFIQLQQALASIDESDHQTYIDQRSQQRFKFSGNKLALDDNFTFMLFERFIHRSAPNSPPCSLVRDNLSFLENEIEAIARQIQRHSKLLNSNKLSLVHLELYPSNFGFNDDHTVAVIYDFDSLNYGLPLQDTGWLCATFCVDYRKPLHQVSKDLTSLLSEIQPQLATNSDWRELLLPFMRLGYLDAIHRKVQRAYDGIDTRMGYVKEDLLCLRWLRQHDSQLTSLIQQIGYN